MSSRRQQSGQAMVLTLVFLTVLMVMAAAVLDVGSWYHAHRQAQATADAAALAGAQQLPDTGQASGSAVDYANRNGGGVQPADVAFSTTVEPNDTIRVTVRRTAPTFFAKLFRLDSVAVTGRARALSSVAGEARYAAPIGVDILHPMLQCEPVPCFNQQTTLDLQRVGPGAFRLINIDGSRGGTSPAILADWILHGFDGYMPLEWYFSDPGARFNSSQVRSALQQSIGRELLFPVYRRTRRQGSNFEYEVVGWVGFHITGFQVRGNSGQLYGWFTHVVWEGIGNEHSTGDDFGARTISLVE